MNKFLRRQILAAFIAAFALTVSSCAGIDTRFIEYESAPVISLEEIPEYFGSPYIEINGGKPSFDNDDLTDISFESYSELDYLGRCQYAYANLSLDTMPTEKRGKIGMIKPSGWQTVRYDFVDGKYLYNRCHLIGYQLSAENANEKNLITGTRYMNVDGMLPFENKVADYIKATGHHVLYRVTPVFDGENLLADGVLMEAMSVEDSDISFCVFCYNVQPGVVINYADGTSREESDAENQNDTAEDYNYILNVNSKRFHRPECASAADMKPANRRNYSGTREELIKDGYNPCGVCNP